MDEGDRIAALTREIETLRAEVERLRLLADHDTLTPVLNRRAFVRELSRTIAYCRRYGATAAVLYLDLDGFKAVNDQFGHPAGDAALVRIAELLTAHVRESDVVARLGGDEFAVLLLQVDAEAAAAKARSLAEAIAAEAFAFEGRVVPPRRLLRRARLRRSHRSGGLAGRSRRGHVRAQAGALRI